MLNGAILVGLLTSSFCFAQTVQSISLCLREGLIMEKDDVKLYLVWDMNADSWTGTRRLITVELSLEDAEATARREFPGAEKFERPAAAPYVKNYAYVAIEERKPGQK